MHGKLAEELELQELWLVSLRADGHTRFMDPLTQDILAQLLVSEGSFQALLHHYTVRLCLCNSLTQVL